MIKHFEHMLVGRGSTGFHHEAPPGTNEACPVCGRLVVRLPRTVRGRTHPR